MKKTFDTEKKLYTLSLLVQDIPGVLSQVARLFSRKGYNIESIVSGETSQPGLTRITIVILGDELMVNQIAAQCRKLIPVQVVKILDEETSIQREFAMIKVTAVDRTTPMGFTYVAHATVEGLNYQTAYEFQARAEDALEQVESEVKVVKASPGFDWGKDDFAFHIPVYIEGVKVTPDVGQNLLINPLFTVNQRGSTTYAITKPAYTMDCWKTSGDTKAGEVVVGQRYAKLTNTSGTLGLGQFVEDYGDLAGETVTLSMAVDILSGSYHLGLNDGTGQAGEVLSQKGLQVYALTATLSDSPSQLWCQLISEGAASCRIFAAKLEVGDHQTLAIQGEDGTWQLTQQPNPEEILRCYRYQYVPVEGDTSYPLGYGFAFSTSSARMVFPCGVKMRLAPSVTFLNGSNLSGIGIFNNGASHTPTAVAGTRNLPGGVGVIFTTSGLVTNDVCTLRSISGKLLFDANL